MTPLRGQLVGNPVLKPLFFVLSSASSPLRPRHIVGSEDVTEPFWRAYQRHAPGLRWTRREPVFAARKTDLCEASEAARPAVLESARGADRVPGARGPPPAHRPCS